MALDFKNRQGYAEGEIGDEFGYQKAIRKQMRKDLRATPGIMEEANQAYGRQMESQGAQVMAQAGSRDLGALTDIGSQFRQQAASGMYDRAMNTQQAKLDAMGAEAAMDTPQQTSDKAMEAAQDRINLAIKETGTVGEQKDVADEILRMLETERDPTTRKYLQKREAEIRKAGGWGAQFVNTFVPFADSIGEDV